MVRMAGVVAMVVWNEYHWLLLLLSAAALARSWTDTVRRQQGSDGCRGSTGGGIGGGRRGFS